MKSHQRSGEGRNRFDERPRRRPSDESGDDRRPANRSKGNRRSAEPRRDAWVTDERRVDRRADRIDDGGSRRTHRGDSNGNRRSDELVLDDGSGRPAATRTKVRPSGAARRKAKREAQRAAGVTPNRAKTKRSGKPRPPKRQPAR